MNWIYLKPNIIEIKREDPITDIRNEKGDISTDPTDIRRVKEYSEQLSYQ